MGKRKSVARSQLLPAAVYVALCAAAAAQADEPSLVEAPPATATPAQDTDAIISVLSEMDLESLLKIGVSQLDSLVVSSTKTAQRAAQTPAVVTIITGDEILGRGYTSLAAALRTVPGFYDVDDLVTHNLGVRGINGGKGASGNVVLVMIDGMPVDYAPSTGNFLGPELIPLEMIERVEIIRGPASALYGANAFLGAINIITRASPALSGARLTAEGGATRTLPMGGGTAVVGAGNEKASLSFGASYSQQDRSGLTLPSSSPVLGTLVGPTIAKRGASKDDLSRPLTALLKAEIGDIGGGQLSLLGSMQRLDSVNEFNELGPLTHGSRVQLLNQNYRLAYTRDWEQGTSLTAGVRYFNARPTTDDRLDIGNANYDLLHHESVSGAGASLEGHLKLSSEASLVAGTDLVVERHRLLTYDQRWSQNVYDTNSTLLHKAKTKQRKKLMIFLIKKFHN